MGAYVTRRLLSSVVVMLIIVTLSFVLVRAVPGIDYRAINLLRQELYGASRVMAYDDNVGAHGVECHGRVKQRLALLDRRRGDVHIQDVGTQAFGGKFEGGLRSCRGLKEQID